MSSLPIRLQTLISVSQDFEGSLKNVQVAMDLAADKQIDLGTAADLVGRAMVGETGTLKRYGIIVREGADAVEVMREQFRGAAENDAKKFGGVMAQLKNETGDLKEALGDFITQSRVATGVIAFLRDRIKEATERIIELRETDAETAGRKAASAVQKLSQNQLLAAQKNAQTELEKWSKRWGEGVRLRINDVIDNASRRMSIAAAQLTEVNAEIARRQQLPGVSVSAEDAKQFWDDLDKAHADEIKQLAQLAELGLLTNKERARAVELETQLEAEIAAGIPDIERRLEIAQRLQAVYGIIAKLNESVEKPPVAALATPSVPGQLGVVRLTKEEEKAWNRRRELQAITAEEFLAQLDAEAQKAQMVANIMTNAFTDFFERLLTGSENAGGALVAGLLEGLAQYLEVRAAAAFAEALFPPNPAALAQGIAFSAAAGAARALEASLGGRGSSRTSSSAALGGASNFGSSRQTTQPAPDITLVLQGDFDALNPKFVRAVDTARREGIQTIGSGNVRLRTVSRG